MSLLDKFAGIPLSSELPCNVNLFDSCWKVLQLFLVPIQTKWFPYREAKTSAKVCSRQFPSSKITLPKVFCWNRTVLRCRYGSDRICRMVILCNPLVQCLRWRMTSSPFSASFLQSLLDFDGLVDGIALL